MPQKDGVQKGAKLLSVGGTIPPPNRISNSMAHTRWVFVSLLIWIAIIASRSMPFVSPSRCDRTIDPRISLRASGNPSHSEIDAAERFDSLYGIPVTRKITPDSHTVEALAFAFPQSVTLDFAPARLSSYLPPTGVRGERAQASPRAPPFYS